MLSIAQVSDTHFGGPPRAAARAHAVLDHLLAMDPRPDVLLVTGDVADHGLPEEYAEARAWLDRWPGPVQVLPGNHDVRAAFCEALLPGGPVERVQDALDVGPVRFLGLDSLVGAPPGERIDHGELHETSLAWLDDQLRSDDRPTFVSLHHPPVDLGIALMAPILLHEPARLAAVVSAHAHVVAVLVGHAHAMTVTTFAGRPLLVGGGVASTVPVDAEPLPVLWQAAPPAFALHLRHDDGRLTSHWRALSPEQWR